MGASPYQGRGIDDLKDERIRRLEQDKEELRAENSSIRASISALQLESSRLESEYQRVCNQMGLAEQQATMDRRDKEELTAKMSQMHRDLDEIRTRHDSERSKLEMDLRSAETRLQRRDSEFEQLKMERDTVVTQLRTDLDAANSRHAHDVAAAAKDHESARDTDRRRYTDLEERYTKEQAEVGRLRDTIKALDDDRRTLEADKGVLKQSVDNKGSLLESVRADAKAKKERIDELVKVVATMESDRKDMDVAAQELKAELARSKKRIDGLEGELQSAEADKAYTDGQHSNYKKAYEDVARILSATDVQTRGMLVNAAAAEAVGKIEKLEHNVSELKGDIEKEKNKLVDAEMKIVQAERARDQHRDALLAHKDELAAEKRKRLELTRAHRALISQEEGHNRTIATQESKIGDLEARLDGEKSLVKTLQEERQEAQEALQKSSAEWYEERTKLQEQAQKEMTDIEMGHSTKLAVLQSTIDEMDSEARDQIEYTDMCKSMARLLRVDVGPSASTTARELYHKVDTMVSEVDNLKKSLREEREREPPRSLNSTVGWSDRTSSSTALASFGTTDRSRSNLDAIRQSLVKQKVEFDAFINEVSTALGVPRVPGDKPNTNVLVQRIVELMSEAPAPGAAEGRAHHRGDPPSRSGRTPRKPPGTPSSSSSGSGRHAREHKRQHEDLQRRYRLALRTIQTLDKLYADMAAKQPALDTLHTEHHQLLEEVTRLKQQLRSGGVVGVVDLGDRGSEPEEVERLRSELKKYIDFYDNVLAALGHRSPNVAMSTLITEIKSLKTRR